MDGFFFLVGCLLLAFPILAIVALVKTVGLSARLGSIEHRMAAMESQQAHRAPTAAPPIPAAPPITPYTPEEPYAPRKPAVEPAQAPAMPPSPERQATVTPPIAPPPQPAPSPPTISFEERLGTQWTVWAGGIALAFGGFFLVRY